MSKTFIDIHSHKKNDNLNVVQILNDDTFLFNDFSFYKNSFYCSGFHPYLLKNNIQPSIVKKHINNLTKNQLLAIGEIGLDRSLKNDFEIQSKIFNDFLELAKHKSLPVFIHCVRAYSDMLHLIKNINFQDPLILHDFRGNIQEINQLTRSPFDFYFSISPSFLKKNDNRKIFEQIPADKLFFESDDTQSPIEIIYQDFSNRFQMNLDSLRYQHVQNFNRLFPHICL
ncbi:TatD family hydrolase [Bacteriovoracaceae bacterium]|nr:TatD family hydrolase [Bacteriovoracaceae bacterium]